MEKAFIGTFFKSFQKADDYAKKQGKLMKCRFVIVKCQYRDEFKKYPEIGPGFLVISGEQFKK